MSYLKDRAMTTERAVEILDPEHREHYDSIEIVNEACRMGMEALKNPLLAFIKEEVPFRLAEIHGVPIDKQDSEMVEEMVDRLWDTTEIMFNYDAIDGLIIEIMKDHGIDAEDEELTNCESGVYSCENCIADGNCTRQEDGDE